MVGPVRMVHGGSKETEYDRQPQRLYFRSGTRSYVDDALNENPGLTGAELKFESDTIQNKYAKNMPRPATLPLRLPIGNRWENHRKTQA